MSEQVRFKVEMQVVKQIVALLATRPRGECFATLGVVLADLLNEERIHKQHVMALLDAAIAQTWATENGNDE